jgi:hypothetical protein
MTLLKGVLVLILSSKAYVKLIADTKLQLFIHDNLNFSTAKNFFLIYDLKLGRFLANKGFEAITLRPFVFVFNDYDLRSGKKNEIRDSLVAHEFTHIIQQRKKGLLLFLIRYLYEYFKLLIEGMGSILAYSMISYEVEARQTEKIVSYYDPEELDKDTMLA